MLRRSVAALFVVALVTAGVVASPPHSAQAVAVVTSPQAGTVLINELANGGQNSDSDSFFELRNWGSTDVNLDGWNIYSCNVKGLRDNIGAEVVPLSGVLHPGDIFTGSKLGLPGDQHTTQPFALGGFGLYLESPDHKLADAVGVYPNSPWPTQSECTVGANLPNRLDFALGESWQRVSATGDVTRDFIAAPSTIAKQNATRPTATAATGVVISELAPSGPAAVDDEFVELRNTGSKSVDLGGWKLYRCTAGGHATNDTLQLTVPGGTKLAAGATWVAAGKGFTGTADARYDVPLADASSGVLLQTASGAIADRLSISPYNDSACQSGDDKLPAILDYATGESYQRTDTSFVIAHRTPGAANATVDTSVYRSPFAYPDAPQVAISEVATDPAPELLPAGATQQNFIELGNYGAATVDIGGWTIRRCEVSGIRSREVQVTVPHGTTLKPGATFLAAKSGTKAAAKADAGYSTALNFLGSGVWVADAHGKRIDSVGIFHSNELDGSIDTASACSKGITLATYQPDRILHQSFQRSRFTGVDADDFVTAPATPGKIDRVAWVDPSIPLPAAGLVDVPAPKAAPTVKPPLPGSAATVLEAWSGTTQNGPLTTLAGTGETRLNAAAPADASDDSYAYPYQRLVLDASTLAVGSRVQWSGSTVGRNELQLSVWDTAKKSWRLLDAATGAAITLQGALQKSDIANARVTLLVQDGPRTKPTLAPAADGHPENPDDYDFAISHITDTQYLTESYPKVYTQLVSWIAANAAPRKIAFATHTGDIVQNWVEPNANSVRVTSELERASGIQSILDKAGIPNSVLPGNHDSKNGVDYSLFNQYFGPERYANDPWYGGSIAPGDNTANFSTFENSGAKFLMLSLPYAYGDREMTWAEQVVASHPDYNVIVSTHEHVTPKTLIDPALRSATSRWVSRGDELWNRVIAPNRNVIAVLSGHFHGLGKIVTKDAGGIKGHSVVELLADYQEFRTDTGERATGFQRLLQLDLDGGTIAVDTFSLRLNASASYEYDYPQFVPDDGGTSTLSNERPWQIVAAGPQGRYTTADDEFSVAASFQFPKLVKTGGIVVAAGAPAKASSTKAKASAAGSKKKPTH